jgi:acetoacetyl-CoA reductase
MKMARVAVVSGGSRGIGAAVSAALKAAGYHVAATYHGNDAAAAKFKAETGIATYKWDVSNYKECAEGLKKVEADLGPIDILVNNAGITRDTPFHRNLGFDVVRLSGRGIHRRGSRTITVINRWKRRRLHE